jgi:hypothetical protein
MNTPHTPSPWLTRKPESSRPESARLDIVTDAGEFSPSFVAGDALPQDARLIAAAPELFDALQAIVDAFGDQNSLLIDQCKAALRKAKGEA